MISGSSRGLGKQLAGYFKTLGYNVITMGDSSEGYVDIRCNLLDIPNLKKELKRTFEIFGAIDILICNAGTGKKPDNTSKESEVRRYFKEKNLDTTRNLLNCSEQYLKSPGASVIGISSIAALTTIEGVHSGYADAKKEMNELFRKQALMLSKRGIRANLISPGNINFSGSRWEEISGTAPKFVEDLLREKVPLHQFITPQEIASAIIYLSSNAAKNITGTNLVIDGGQSL